MRTVARIRRARPDETQVLTDLAIRSKRSWGYDDEFMKCIADDMAVRQEYLEREHAIVAEEAGQIAGYAIVRIEDDRAFLRDLFIDPPYMNKGIGAMLLREALAFAWAHGATRFSLVSDPNAVAFYARYGFEVISQEPSAYVPGRTLPVMAKDLP